jgi:flagellar assembly factor FliW
MAQIATRQFGSLDYNPQDVLEFPAGLPGFEELRQFILIERPAFAPVLFLQSLDSPNLSFAAAPIDRIDPQYELSVTPEDLRLLAADRPEGMVALSILSAPENGPLTANLLAPVVIDPRTRRAVQAVRVDSRYSHQHPLSAPITKQGEKICS